MLDLILVRHGETEWNEERRYQGQSDIPLSVSGEQQAALVAEALLGRKFDAIYSSDLKRAWQTAAAIVKKNNQTVLPETRLREMNFGILEGLTWDEAEEKYPEILKAWLEDYNHPPESGETMDAFSLRVLSFFEELKSQYTNETILLVAHGGVLREIIRLALELPAEKLWALAMDNASISELFLGKNDYPVLKKLNDTCHLDT